MRETRLAEIASTGLKYIEIVKQIVDLVAERRKL